ncbi:hypothetical protein SAMN05216464_11931 [Mucilaginibacter pineti]|uniref:Uncharacterized protein n=1 Tax=Mucilaginibacter pineti TaxID=1391627 RepID=A0A1G7LLQ7_9SPHI|nr:hypothetical protein [Mucilaginibacter pineti]SDF50353.1 hypothetical protein SAMN05216464_11931 [Mucilaginibacter pineti]
MPYEIHIYVGAADITEKYGPKYPMGERHAFLLYLRADNNSEYNLTEAEEMIIGLGLGKIEFSKVGKLSLEKVNNDEKREYYNNAMKNGSTLIVYSDPI